MTKYEECLKVVRKNRIKAYIKLAIKGFIAGAAIIWMADEYGTLGELDGVIRCANAINNLNIPKDNTEESEG